MTVTTLPQSEIVRTSETGGFRQVTVPGLEITGEHTVQAGAVFNDRLFLGIVSYPQGNTTKGIARILRFSLARMSWEIVYSDTLESPIVSVHGRNQRVPLELGFRAMQVVSGQDGDALYVSLVSLRNAKLLASRDGENFRSLPNPAGAARGAPFGQLFSFGGRLFAAPVGRTHTLNKPAENACPVIYVTNPDQPDAWVAACLPGFGDDTNQVIHGFSEFNGELYAAVGNGLAGFQLWKTRAQGQAPYHWEKVLDKGVQRYTQNSGVPGMAVFNNTLYLGTGLPPSEPAEKEPHGSEIIRVSADGTWELVMGTPRFSPIGIQIPASAHGAGFGEKANNAITQLASHNGALYAAVTTRIAKASEGVKTGGFQLWRTRNGDDWEVITRDAFHTAQASDVRMLLSAPWGLVVAGAWNGDRGRGAVSVWVGGEG